MAQARARPFVLSWVSSKNGQDRFCSKALKYCRLSPGSASQKVWHTFQSTEASCRVFRCLKIFAWALSNEQAIIDRIAETFPRLKQRLSQEAVTLSGGEQQMLAIARAIMVMLDEPSEGIMPLLVEEMFEYFLKLRKQGATILLVEQNVEIALSISDRAYIVDQGRIVHGGTARELLADNEIQEKYCSI
jgi:ABC-type lipopolysaccharide export system ATPase subunit